MNRNINWFINDNRGLALPTVLMIIAIITLITFTAIFVVQSQTALGVKHATSEEALYYAESGLHKYLWHLNKDSNYYRHGTAGNPYTFPPDAIEPGIEMPFQNGTYVIEVGQPTEAQPWVIIKASGWANYDSELVINIEAAVQKKQFSQYAYFSNSERLADGTIIWWINGDEVFGPYHTNESLRIGSASPIFFGPASYTNSIVNQNLGDFRQGLEKISSIDIPPNNTQLMMHAQLNGKVFDGLTRILLDGNQIMVRNVNIDPSQPNKVHIYNIQNDIPNGVIYINGSTGVDTGNNTNKFTRTGRGNLFISGNLSSRLTIAAANDIYITGRDPTNDNFAAAAITNGISYDNIEFDPVTEEGVVVGYQASKINANGTDDILGLIANNHVRILGYRWFTGTTQNVAPAEINITAAVFAVNGGFEYEANTEYNKGTIKLRGSLIQSNRGIVARFGAGGKTSGYLKDYAHDSRMIYDTPPSFLEPTEAGWEVIAWKFIQ